MRELESLRVQSSHSLKHVAYVPFFRLQWFFKIPVLGVYVVKPVSAQWKYVDNSASHVAGQRRCFIRVIRWQIPVAPTNQKTLQTLQGMTTKPGPKAHWRLRLRLSRAFKWLAYYVMLSPPQSLETLLTFGLPDSDVLDGGPPQELLDALGNLFGQKILESKVKAALARKALGWPARP